MHEQTMEFSVQHDKEAELKKTLTIIYDALKARDIRGRDIQFLLREHE